MAGLSRGDGAIICNRPVKLPSNGLPQVQSHTKSGYGTGCFFTGQRRVPTESGCADGFMRSPMCCGCTEITAGSVAQMLRQNSSNRNCVGIQGEKRNYAYLPFLANVQDDIGIAGHQTMLRRVGGKHNLVVFVQRLSTATWTGANQIGNVRTVADHPDRTYARIVSIRCFYCSVNGVRRAVLAFNNASAHVLAPCAARAFANCSQSALLNPNPMKNRALLRPCGWTVDSPCPRHLRLFCIRQHRTNTLRHIHSDGCA